MGQQRFGWSRSNAWVYRAPVRPPMAADTANAQRDRPRLFAPAIFQGLPALFPQISALGGISLPRPLRKRADVGPARLARGPARADCRRHTPRAATAVQRVLWTDVCGSRPLAGLAGGKLAPLGGRERAECRPR